MTVSRGRPRRSLLLALGPPSDQWSGDARKPSGSSDSLPTRRAQACWLFSRGGEFQLTNRDPFNRRKTPIRFYNLVLGVVFESEQSASVCRLRGQGRLMLTRFRRVGTGVVVGIVVGLFASHAWCQE